MNYFLAALVGLCLCVTYLAQAEPNSQKEGFYYEQRPRLGHFKQEPFKDLYKTYAAAFIKGNFQERHNDDYKNYLPSGNECVQFFKEFRIKTFKLNDIDEIVKLDACLGYLYESEYHEVDSKESKNVADNLQQMIAEPIYQEIYKGTKINETSLEAKECIGTLLIDAIRVKNQYKEVLCNQHWLDVFNNFASCQKEHIPAEARKHDSYLRIIYDLTKARGNECFENEIAALNRAVREKYKPLEDIENTIRIGKLRFQKKQSKSRLWPKPVVNLLRAVQGHPKQINLREINQIVRGVINGKEVEEKKFLEHMALHSDKTIKAKQNSKSTKKDPSGLIRYNDMVDKLCNFFRSSDSQKMHDFTTPFKNMVRMLDYPEIFNIDNDKFIKKVLTHSYETAPLYLCVSSCNILAFTEGAFERTAQNGPLKYNVLFQPDTTSMVRWPDAGFD